MDTAEWEHRAEPCSAEGWGGSLARVLLPGELPLWAARAGVCRCELCVQHFHPCQFLGRGSQGEEDGLLLPSSFSLRVWREKLMFLPVCTPCQDLQGK